MFQFLSERSKLPLVSLLIGLVLLLNALAASPKLHEQFHSDAGQSEHQCAATLFAHGQVDVAAPLAASPVPAVLPELLLPSVSALPVPLAGWLPAGRAPPVFI